jgi:multidrug efflux pump subunit AcrB
LALTLVVGVLVDDAIVEVENIVRHLRMGMSPMQAAMAAATEIGTAVIATTFTLVAVFLPTAFMGGIPGKFFKQFGWTAAISVLVSLLVARMLTPLMAAYFLKDHPNTTTEDGSLTRWYMGRLDWVLSNPLKTLGLATGLFIASMGMAPFLSSGFIPASQQGKLNLQVELAPGASFKQTEALVMKALEQLKGIPDIKQTYVSIGSGSSGSIQGGGGKAGEVRRATIALDLTETRSQAEIERDVRAVLSLPGARVSVAGMGSGQSYTLVLSSDNPGLLAQTAQAVERDLRTLSGVGAVASSASLTRPEIVVRPDSAQAAELGVTTQTIGQTLRVATAGDTDTALAKLNLPDRQIPVRVQFPAHVREDLDLIAQLKVPAKNGAVPLFRVADLSIESGAAQINRYDRSRNVTLTVELAGRALGDVSAEANKLPSIKALPAGVTRQASGDAERMAELMGGFAGAMLLGMFCIYGVLVLLLHNFAQPLTILSALPLAVGGALLALLLGNYALSLPSLIGLLMLMGVVTKNSILLVDYAMLAKKDGVALAAAMRDACHKRARPILMTTVAMVAGMVPLMMGWAGGDSSFRAPMAATVIGGLITSTALSLLVVPAVFLTVGRAQGWMAARIKLLHP